MAATLIDRGLRPWEIARLTLRQKTELYFHPRDKDGHIKIPDVEVKAAVMEKPLTLEEELSELDKLNASLTEVGIGFAPAKLEALRSDLRKKFGVE